MKYALLIYADPAAGPPPGTPEGDAEMAQWFAITEEMQRAGVIADEGAALEPHTAARTARPDGVVSDGPFAETKEVLGGFYVLDVPDQETALSWAARLPHMAYGSTEVRPVMEFTGE